ncbi:cupin-like domain-containing protein [Uliginosibacterium sp. H3]|uniref:Cupin-like domain-containing protein n=1 Tax=Uliginosibacterium silvisoli TaxID=3114758 RepID=A0ABU6JYS8_9RHOO|nr:cupin-like domain-containing protein [Uliginosibacterium sp. H3]
MYAKSNPVGAMRMTDEWRRWLAENLILDNHPQGLFETLVRAGVSVADAHHEVNAALSSPYIAGAQRLKNRLAKHDWILDNQRRMGQLRSPEVPRLDKLSADAFLNDFYAVGQPVVITGMMDDWPARQKWDFDYFKNNFGDKEVQVQFGRNSDEHYELNKLKHQKTMPFGEYVDLVRNAGKTNDFYMTANNDSQNRVALSGLWQDIVQIPEYLTPDAPGGFFWFGPAGTVTPFHHDLTNNFMAQVIGRKRVLMVPAYEVNQIYNHEHCFTHVDGRGIDYERYPAMRNARVLEAIIGPGDILFLPVGCWHFVEGLDVSVTVSFTNFRWDNNFTENYPSNTAF